MKQRFSTGQREDDRTELAGMVDAALERSDINWRRGVVVLVAITAREIASPGHHELNEQRAIRRREHACTTSDVANRIDESNHGNLMIVFRVPGSGFRVPGSGFRVPGS